MGLSSICAFFLPPSCRDIADDRLPAGVNMHMLDGHFLFAAATQVRQRLNLGRESPLQSCQRYGC